jgi:hypothetical protein
MGSVALLNVNPEGSQQSHRTENREEIVQWYRSEIGAEVWLEQPGCTILSYEGFRFGFCEADDGETETCGILTFVYETTDEVDSMYAQLEDAALEEPDENERYQIYQFFAEDPDGRTTEFQSFLHETPPLSG